MPRKAKKVSKKADTKDKPQSQKRPVVGSSQKNKRKPKASQNNGAPEPVRPAAGEEQEQVELEKNGESSEVSVSETSDTKDRNNKSDDEVENGESDQQRTTTSSPEEDHNEEPTSTQNQTSNSSSLSVSSSLGNKPSENPEKKPEITVQTASREKLNLDENVDEHSEEEKKPTDSPSSSGDEDEDEEESDPEPKQPDQQPIDLSETATNFKRNGDSSYIPLRAKISRNLAAYIPSSPFKSMTSAVSTSFHNLYTSLSSHTTYLGSKAKHFLTSSPSTSTTSETTSEEHSGRRSPFVTPWLSQLVIHLKFLFLALFYLHLGLWALVSLVLIGINICSFFFGPWAVFPIGGWGVGLYIHLIGTSYILQVSGASTKELSWVENPLYRAFGQVKGLTHTAREVANHKYQDLCTSWRCQGARA